MGEGFKTAYGLEVSAGRMILARSVRRGLPQVVLTVAAGSDEAQRVLKTVAGEVARGAAALAVSAPATQTVIRRLRAPFASAAKAAKVWASLLDVDLPFPVESAVCAYVDPHVEDGGTVAIAAAVRTPEFIAFTDACRAEGFDPTHCDAEALALWTQQGAEAPPARAGQPRVVVWLGAEHITVVRGRGVVLLASHVIRAVPASGGTAFEGLWTARMRQILEMHLAETGGSELDLWWAGPGAEDEGVVERLRRALPGDLAVRHEIHRQPGSLLVRALARRAAEGSGVNFRMNEFTHPALTVLREKALRRAYGGVMAAAILVLALNLGEAALRHSQAALLQERLTQAAQAIAGNNIPRGQERLMVERAIALRDRETQPFRDALDPVGQEGQLVRVLTETQALGIEISRLSLSAAAILIEGSAMSIQAVEGLSDRLRLYGWTVQSESPGRTPEGRQQFILKGTARNEG